MPREQVKHAVRLQIDTNCYNVLISALKENQSGDSDYVVERANALLSKIEKHTRFYLEGETKCAELRFFESEAKNLILQLLQAFSYYSSDDEDYYHAVIDTE